MPRTKPINPKVKYYPPRLLKQLEYMKDYPLTLVEAPSGFGKTTVLEYFFDTRLPQSILRERYEFVPRRAKDGWRHLCDMLSKIDDACARRLLAIGPPDEDTIPEIAQALQTLECLEDAYLWLDDFMNW